MSLNEETFKTVPLDSHCVRKNQESKHGLYLIVKENSNCNLNLIYEIKKEYHLSYRKSKEYHIQDNHDKLINVSILYFIDSFYKGFNSKYRLFNVYI